MSERAHWGRLIGGSIAVLAAAFVAPRFVLAPHLDENRRLAEAPAVPKGLGGLTDYRHAVDAYVADRFPPRAHLIAALNRARLLFGVSGSSRVIVGRDGWLFYDDGTHMGPARGAPPFADAAQAAWLAGLAGRTEFLAAQGKAYVVLSPPQKESLYPGQTPSWFRLDHERPAVALRQLARASKAGDLIYVDGDLAQQAQWGLRVYPVHDTHWTGLGAYYGYAALMADLQARGITDGPRPMSAFPEIRKGEVNKPRNLALMLGVASMVDIDYPELGDPPSEAGVQITYLDPARRDWTGVRVIDTGQAGKPVLMMTLDSFSNALLPFLIGHFSRIVTSHLDQGSWRPDLIARFNPDVVVSEVVEGGLTNVMAQAPAASPEALARISVAQAERRRLLAAAAARAKAAPKGPAPPVRAIEGDDGPNHLVGSDGPDDIQGRPGDDTVEGRGGPDVLRGGRGADRIDGGEGDDWVSGGRGDDTLTGGRGADVFSAFSDADNDVVTDFSIAEGDRIELDPGTTFKVVQEGADAVIVMPAGRLVLKGVKAADLPKGAVRVRAASLASGG